MILGLANSIGKIFGTEKRTLSVLCYHGFSKTGNKYSIEPRIFEAQIKKILTHSRVISIEEAISVLAGKQLSGPAIVLTIDDGYADVLNVASIIAKYQIPVTLFVLSDPRNANRSELDHNGRLLSWQELRHLSSLGWTIGCHSATHADFSNLSKKEIKKEIIYAKKMIEEKLETKVKYFAYPKGIFNERIVQLVKKAGYQAAFGIQAGTVTHKSNRWVLPRTIINKTHQISEFPTVYSPTSFAIHRATDRFKLWDKFLTA